MLAGAILRCGLLVGLLAAPARAAVHVEARVDTSAVYVGDLITYRMEITYDDGDTVWNAPHGINLYSFRVHDYAPLERHRTPDGRWQLGDEYKITAYRPGTYVIPPVPIEYRTAAGRSGELVTQPLVIRIKSLGVGEGDTLRDIKPPVDVPTQVQPWVWIALSGVAAALLLAAAAVLWAWRRAQSADAPPPVSEVVDEIAEFDRIPADELIAGGDIHGLYALVSEAVRRYAGRRYCLDAMELTHQELAAAMEEGNIRASESELILTFLARCDLVKFALFIPPEEEVSRLIAHAKDVVRRTQFPDATLDESCADETEVLSPASPGGGA